MTRLGSFVRENERPGRLAIQSAIDAVPLPAAVLDVAFRRHQQEAREAGASEALITFANAMSTDHGARTRLATLRLLHRVGSGDESAMTPLLNKLPPNPPDELFWDVMSLAGYDTAAVRTDEETDLVEFFADEIRRGFSADGFSQVFEWLLSNGRVSNDSPALRPLLEQLISSSLEVRARAERLDPPFESADVFAALADLGAGSHSIMLSGPSLLVATRPQESFGRFGVMEFATLDGLDSLLSELPSSFRLLDRRGGHASLHHVPTDRTVNLVHLDDLGDRFVHGDGRFSRWYSRFDVVEHDIDGRRFLGPADIEQYLDERFGDWRGSPFFYDPILDAPNTSIDRSLDGLLFVYFKLRSTFATGRRHYADEWAAIMRDRFGIDYSNFVPRGVPRKVLATPVTPAEVGERQVHLVIGEFSRVDAQFVAWLDEQRSDDVYLVAAVNGHRLDLDAIERLALANSLRAIDHATLIESDDDLVAPIPGVEVTTRIMCPDFDDEATA